MTEAARVQACGRNDIQFYANFEIPAAVAARLERNP
jgi:hypothetical protein